MSSLKRSTEFFTQFKLNYNIHMKLIILIKFYTTLVGPVAQPV
jgi:hypothetical protein